MQPEQLIGGPNTAFEVSAGVKFCDFRRPSVPFLYSRNKLLADAKFVRDVFLHESLVNHIQNLTVAFIQRSHAVALPLDDFQCVLKFFRLDDYIRAQKQKQLFNVWRIGNGVAIKALASPIFGAPILFNSSVSKPLVDGLEGGLVCVCQPCPNIAFGLVDFDTAFAIKKASDVAQKGGFCPIFHGRNDTIVLGVFAMAVPVVKWILDRVRAQWDA